MPSPKKKMVLVGADGHNVENSKSEKVGVVGGNGATLVSRGGSSSGGGWGSRAMRLLRRRAVLGFIFCASFLYCVITVIRDHNGTDNVDQYGTENGNSNVIKIAVPLLYMNTSSPLADCREG